MPKWLLFMVVGIVLGVVFGGAGTIYFSRLEERPAASEHGIEQPSRVTPYPGMEFLYSNLEYRHGTVLSGKSCPDSKHWNQECEAGQKAIDELLTSTEYAVDFELFHFIADHIGEPVYLRLFFKYVFDDVPAESGYYFSLPGTNDRISKNDTIEERFERAKENSSSNLQFGHPDRALGAGIILEDPRLVVNGINEVVHHPAGPVEIRGFFKFEVLGQEKGVHFYRGRVIPVDMERGLLTEKYYSKVYLMLGSVQSVWKSSFIESIEKNLLKDTEKMVE